MRKCKPTLIVVFWLLLSVPALAQQYKTLLDKVQLADGDAVVFLGDSITHQSLYTQYVEDYYYMRYPNIRINFHNAGTSGDQACDALTHFDEDVARFHPKYVFILLGMNDGRYQHFDRESFDEYEQLMTRLLDKTAQINAIAIPMSPTMFDARTNRVIKGDRSEICNTYYNGVLAFYGSWLRDQALDRGIGFVDLHGPLNQAIFTRRKTDPQFTVIPDGFHPGPAGHAIMAFSMLKEINAQPEEFSIDIRRDQKKWQGSATGGTLENLKSKDKKISFTFTARSLPWVLPDDARPGYEIVDAGSILSKETLRINGLKPGTYQLLIDGNVVGDYCHLDLGRGIELQENTQTPQYQQAVKVMALNKKRTEDIVYKLRDWWLNNRVNPDIKNTDPAGYETKITAFRAEVDKLAEQNRQYEDEIYRINKPQAHQYEIVPAEQKSQEK